ncbi:hypothetical protein [Actinoplanes couchii]|uniref:CBS domain-containing protein n=1 Tax=Actinoplanes couchii TaxID=403638 RepID=A0ABQ3X9C5_9ACTN|nr:hypothetical protein [Actinoplanes couchii]MDR6325724.1 hypothetical protein [Actinoplanes couchii]GID55107.1 hypothetical protein Aco03nite_035110 [Actinoplanes couchii]
MPLELHEETANLVGVVTVDEVEQLVGWLRTAKRPRVALRRCNHLHTGALQALLLFRPKISSAPADAFLAAQVLPLLAGGGGPAKPGSESP